MTDNKIINIETTLAHHDRQIQDLSEIIMTQWKVIERLQGKLEETLSKIDDMGTDTPITKPPHY